MILPQYVGSGDGVCGDISAWDAAAIFGTQANDEVGDVNKLEEGYYVGEGEFLLYSTLKNPPTSEGTLTSLILALQYIVLGFIALQKTA